MAMMSWMLNLDVSAGQTHNSLHGLGLYLSTSRGELQGFEGFRLMPFFQGKCTDHRDVRIPAQRILEQVG